MKIIKPFLYSLIALIFISCNDPANSPYPNITFKTRTSLPGVGRASAVAFVIDGRGYVALGRDSQRSGMLNDCWQYNPDSDSWKQRANFPGIARVKAMAAVVDHKAYVGLGFNIDLGVYDFNACLKDFWMYDPATDIWTKMADFPSNYSDACASFVSNNIIYQTSGMNGVAFGEEVWKYVPQDGQPGSWVRMKDFPGTARAGGIACSIGDRCYFGTGYMTANKNDWWEYFPSNDTWKHRKAMPDNGRENSVSMVINNRILIATGRHFGGNLTGGHVDSDIVEYDLISNVWYERGNIPNEGRENAIAFTINGKGYIGYGENDTQVLNDFYCFEP